MPGLALGAAVLLTAVVLVATAVALVVRALRPDPMTPYVAPLWWLGYDDGFVRRGLPGAVLRAVAGGPPSLALANAAGVGLTVAGIAALVVLAVALARRAPDRGTALAVAAAVLVTPLGVSHTARDLGRPDALGVLVAVLLVTLPWARLPPLLAVVLVVVLTSAAVGAEELLAVLVLPLAWLALRSAFPTARVPWPALAVLPGVALAVLSAVVPVPSAAILRARGDAAAAGVGPPEPLPRGPADHDAVSRLGHGLLDNLRAYDATTSVPSVLVTTALWAAVHLLLLGLVWRLLGPSRSDRTFRLLVVGSVAVALALSVVGIDYRRWWALATVGALCAAVLLTPRPPVERSAAVGRGTGVGLVALAAAGLLLRLMPVLPLEPVHLERLLQGLG
ncbi:hypothetical protein ACFFOM_10025 [Microlunatus capsulatus]|uniref:Glycosyltransferase RgtA/B/C/D-like domain-containing protein n=1 Tax=Microlunatus capsulatus TaxID=99117 RepID=A0ABS4ZB43_9ACTN|nr:hypothetical protein [Microlunatus capsulatus]MBP2417927.1 hypothetical protein [Microlunatus capsulatus]